MMANQGCPSRIRYRLFAPRLWPSGEMPPVVKGSGFGGDDAILASMTIGAPGASSLGGDEPIVRGVVIRRESPTTRPRPRFHFMSPIPVQTLTLELYQPKTDK